MMDIAAFEHKINNYLMAHSGLEGHRDYLGISQIYYCPRRTLKAYYNGIDMDDLFAHQLSYAGYLFERDMIQRLRGMNLLRNKQDDNEVVAPFDSRFRGHVDGQTADLNLLEIKSLNVRKFEQLKEHPRALPEHYAQVLLYMKYGGFPACWMIYICRETMEHKVLLVEPDDDWACILEQKAKRMLAAIDRKELLPCECHNYCQ